MAKLKRRGSIWYAWVPKSGGGTRLVSTNCVDRAAAEKAQKRLERMAIDPVGEQAAQTTVADALTMLLTDRASLAKQGELSSATVEFYQRKAGVVLDCLAAIFKRKPGVPIYLSEIGAGTVDAYILARREDGVKEATIGHEMTTWRAAMRIAKRRGLWGADVDATFPKNVLSRGKPRSRWLTFEELGKLFHAMVRPLPVRKPADWSADDERRLVWLHRRGLDRFEISADLTARGVRAASPASVQRRLRAIRLRTEGVVAAEPRGDVIGREAFSVVAFAIATSAEWSALERARPGDVAPDLSSARVRGSKNLNRDRVVPLQLLPFRMLLSYALENGGGQAGRLLSLSPNFRRILAEACARAGIPRCSPNDLRRTHAKWLRLSGVAPANIAPSMGHADSRMVERVYGKASAEELAHVQAAEIAALPSGDTVRLMYGAPVPSGPTEEPGDT